MGYRGDETKETESSARGRRPGDEQLTLRLGPGLDGANEQTCLLILPPIYGISLQL